MFDYYNLEESFRKLTFSYSLKNLKEFTSLIYLPGSSNLQYEDSFEKFIYSKSDENEIYNQKERSLIEHLPSSFAHSEYAIINNYESKECHLIAFDLTYSNDLIVDAIAIMKLCKKAINAFCSFIFVNSSAVYLGCFNNNSSDKINCFLSYPITSNIDWDSLLNLTLEITIDEGFETYYDLLFKTVIEINECYDEMYLHNKTYSSLICFNDSFYDERQNIEEPYCCDEFLDTENIDLTQFYEDVNDAMEDLSFIKSNKINSLELLIEADKIEEKSIFSQDLNDIQHNDYSDNKIENSEELIKLLDDPEALIKKL